MPKPSREKGLEVSYGDGNHTFYERTPVIDIHFDHEADDAEEGRNG
jgi:hypothetical protein